MQQALRELEQYSGINVVDLVAIELDGANTPVPATTASQTGLKTLDGDTCQIK